MPLLTDKTKERYDEYKKNSKIFSKVPDICVEKLQPIKIRLNKGRKRSWVIHYEFDSALISGKPTTGPERRFTEKRKNNNDDLSTHDDLNDY